MLVMFLVSVEGKRWSCLFWVPALWILEFRGGDIVAGPNYNWKNYVPSSGFLPHTVLLKISFFF